VLQQQVQAVRSGGPPPRQLRGNGPAPRGEDTAYKIALLGPLQAGKTKIASQICNISFPNKYEPTAGVRYVSAIEATITGQLQLAGRLERCSEAFFTGGAQQQLIRQ
jgi:GTPase SAR1 family protein